MKKCISSKAQCLWSSWAHCWAQETLRCDQLSAFKTKMNCPWDGCSEENHVHPLPPEPGTWQAGPEQTEVRSPFWTGGESYRRIKAYLGDGRGTFCFFTWGWALCVLAGFVSEVVGVAERSSLILGETQENKVVCLTHGSCHLGSCPPPPSLIYGLICFRPEEIPRGLELGQFGTRPEFPPGF